MITYSQLNAAFTDRSCNHFEIEPSCDPCMLSLMEEIERSAIEQSAAQQTATQIESDFEDLSEELSWDNSWEIESSYDRCMVCQALGADFEDVHDLAIFQPPAPLDTMDTLGPTRWEDFVRTDVCLTVPVYERDDTGCAGCWIRALLHVVRQL